MRSPLIQASSPRQVLLILVAIWLGLMLYNGLTQISGLLTIRDFETNFFEVAKILTTSTWLPWAFVSPLIVALGRRWPIEPGRWLVPLMAHVIALLVISLAIGVALGYLYHYSDNITELMRTYQPWQHAGHYLFGDRLFLFNVIVYTVFIAAFNIHNFYTLAVQRERDSAELSSKLQAAQLQALKMQVNPHFLFNTLNSISVLILKRNNDKARDMIQRLGNFFRATIDDTNDLAVPLSKEIEALAQYLAIEQVRFADRLNITTDYNSQTLSVLVPPLILQPIVENAIRHGVEKCEHACELVLRSKLKGNSVVLTVTDNGGGCNFEDTNFSEGLGISNVKARLQQYYREKHSLEFCGEKNKGVMVTLTIPTTNPIKDQPTTCELGPV